MSQRMIRVWCFIVVLAAAGLGACGGQPHHYTPVDEVAEGPGLFSGEDGEFVIYRAR